MVREIITSLNWIDFLMLGIMVRIVVVGSKTGFFIELFKLVGIVFAVFVTYHYYTPVAAFLVEEIHFAPFLANMAAFGFLWSLVVLIFKLIRDGMMVVIKIQANGNFEQWAGLIIGLGRGVLVGSMTLMLLYASGNKYLAKYSNRSLTGPLISDVSVNIYESIYHNAVSKFFETEKLNMALMKSRNINDAEE